ncbi:LuxR C-terminal-related transcriptional regulator [Amycolatopsis sp. NBC_00345]|uniref:LuxR C-terminal-related transcriptional regulator n=1 Tax=Amycolatopsis sp. NBC_00345 TaxID=2975955 RepID=UPI002E265F1E
MGADTGGDSVAERAAPRRGGGVVARTALMARIGGAARVTVVSASAGSGKSVLLRSWAGQAGVAGRTAWVSVRRDERVPQRFWLSVLDALRRTGPGSVLVGQLSAAPELDGWAVVERLLADLAPLDGPLWLVVDDVHELGLDALRQLELLMLRAPAGLRFVVASRHDVRLGLHRLRLEGELAELRTADLRFSVAEARELLVAAGVDLPEETVVLLHQRTEGWAAGLRLAALSLAGHADPARFVAEFSGSERTVAEYLLAEVLDRQSDQVRRLLLCTSVVERVNGELADLLTGDAGGERVLQDLADANAFVVALDGTRSWFRCHQLFAELLALELRRTAPDQITGLHRAASAWFAGHGYPVEAIRHAQAARDWTRAARLLADHWPTLYLDGHHTVVRDLLTGFPPAVRTADAELAAVAAADELVRGSAEIADQYLAIAGRRLPLVPDCRRDHARLVLGIAGLVLARQHGDLPRMSEQAHRLRATVAAHDALGPGLGPDLRTLVQICVDSTDYWSAHLLHLSGPGTGQPVDQAQPLAQRVGRPYLEFGSLAYQAASELWTSFDQAAEHGAQAVGLAELHGWADEQAAGVAYVVLGCVRALQGRLGEAESWIQRAERTVVAEAQPIVATALSFGRALLELGRGRNQAALTALHAAERPAGSLATPSLIAPITRAFRLQACLRLGDTAQAEKVLLECDDRDRGEPRIATAALRLAQGDPDAAAAELAPVLHGATRLIAPGLLTQAYLLEAMTRHSLNEGAAADRALEHALNRAERDGALFWFMLNPVPDLLNRHSRHCPSHYALITEIRARLTARELTAPVSGPEPLSASEMRILRYLPTNLTAPEIADQLSISRNTVKTHMRNLYAKLGTHRRAEAVTQARAFGLLAPPGRRH